MGWKDEFVSLLIIEGILCGLLMTVLALLTLTQDIGIYKIFLISYGTTVIFLFELKFHDRLAYDESYQYRNMIWYLLLLIPTGTVGYFFGLLWIPSVLIIGVHPTELVANRIAKSLP